MIFVETPLQGAYLIQIEPCSDERGMFARGFCQREFLEHGLKTNIVQCNLSYNVKRGTLRGMHYQLQPMAEVKMVRCIRGTIYDIIIDVRPESKTYLKWYGVELTAENRTLLYVPEGFAHGYQSLGDNTEVFYMVTQYYAPEYERAMRWNDPLFRIKWPILDPILSDKDANHPDFTMEST